MRKTYPGLSNKELAVMKVFWAAGHPMVASDIPRQNPDLNINTVNVAIRNLLKKDYIKIHDIVYSGTVLTRSYEPVIGADQYAGLQIADLFPKDKPVPTTGIVATLLENETPGIETIEKLESMLLDYKKKLPKDKEA